MSPVSPALRVDSLPAEPSGKPLRDCCPTLNHLDPWTSVKGISDGQFLCLTEAKVNCPCRKSHPELQITFFLFFNFIYLFYFLTLQYCIGFANMNLPQVYTCSPSWTLLPPPSPYHPSGSSQCTSPKHPVSCIEPGLVTHFIYDIIHVSMPFSQIIPPSPSPTESKNCSIHQCLFCCLVYRVIVTIFLNSIYMR